MTKKRSSEIFADKEENFVGKTCHEIFFIDFLLHVFLKKGNAS